MSTATHTRRSGTPTGERASRVATLAAQLAGFADSVDDDERAVYEARFDRYSPRNALLIVMQRPDATVVRGFRAWLAEGRCVRKGEHGIQILAPAGSSGEQPSETGAGGAGGDLTQEKVRRYFRITHVFDISQTDLQTDPRPAEAAA